MRKNPQALVEVTSMIENAINPFEIADNKNMLINIGSGKAASPNVTNFFTNVESIGRKAKDKFIEECNINPKRFEETIKKRKLFTFASEGKTYRMKGTSEKVEAVRIERDLFGSILYLALENKIDIGEVLKYPLTPVPLSLCHTDGTMFKTQKPSLMEEIEGRYLSVDPTYIDAMLIDGIFFLHLLVNLLPLFGQVSRHILVKLCNIKASRIDIVFYQVKTPSIKDCERDRRSFTDRNLMYVITGPMQKRPSNFVESLRSNDFKRSLVNFLVDDWRKDEYASIIGNKTIYATNNNECFKYCVKDGNIIKTLEEVSIVTTKKLIHDLSFICILFLLQAM